MKILGVNGILNTRTGTHSFTDKFLARLKVMGYRVYDVQYPLLTAMLSYRDSALMERAACIVSAYDPGDAVVAHSAGCLLTIKAMESLGARFSTVFLFAAAAERDVEIPITGADHIYNIHSEDDSALWWGHYLPGHPFGDLGRLGYTGENPRVENVPVSGYSHNTYADDAHIDEWVRFISTRVPHRKVT